MDDLIYLVSEWYEKDAIGQMEPKERIKGIWADVKSVTRSEWANAGQNGLRPQLVAVTQAINYSGEEIVQIGSGTNARRYGIYRTYFPPDSDGIELYLEAKAGLDGQINTYR